jgi:hypothetical protein
VDVAQRSQPAFVFFARDELHALLGGSIVAVGSVLVLSSMWRLGTHTDTVHTASPLCHQTNLLISPRQKPLDLSAWISCIIQ